MAKACPSHVHTVCSVAHCPSCVPTHKRPQSIKRTAKKFLVQLQSGQKDGANNGEKTREVKTGEGKTEEGQTGEEQTGEGKMGEEQTGEGKMGEGQTAEVETGKGQARKKQARKGQAGEGKAGLVILM